MFILRDLPKYEAIRARASRYPEIDPRAVESFLIILRVASDILAAHEKYLSKHRMSPGSFTVLMILNRDPSVPLNPSELADKCGVTRATMTGLIDGLERKKLLRRDSDPTDRRTILISLSLQGIALLDGMLHDYYKRLARLLGDLSEEDKRSLCEMLLKVRATVQAAYD